jgi:hypothetical protein
MGRVVQARERHHALERARYGGRGNLPALAIGKTGPQRLFASRPNAAALANMSMMVPAAWIAPAVVSSHRKPL